MPVALALPPSSDLLQSGHDSSRKLFGLVFLPAPFFLGLLPFLADADPLKLGLPDPVAFPLGFCFPLDAYRSDFRFPLET